MVLSYGPSRPPKPLIGETPQAAKGLVNFFAAWKDMGKSMGNGTFHHGKSWNIMEM